MGAIPQVVSPHPKLNIVCSPAQYWPEPNLCFVHGRAVIRASDSAILSGLPQRWPPRSPLPARLHPEGFRFNTTKYFKHFSSHNGSASPVSTTTYVLGALTKGTAAYQCTVIVKAMDSYLSVSLFTTPHRLPHWVLRAEVPPLEHDRLTRN